MKNFLIVFVTICLLSFTNNAISENSTPTTPNSEAKSATSNLLHTKRIVAQSYTVNVGRGATYFGISKKLSEVSGVNWSWELVDRVKESHQMKYGLEVLKPNHKFTISI